MGPPVELKPLAESNLSRRNESLENSGFDNNVPEIRKNSMIDDGFLKPTYNERDEGIDDGLLAPENKPARRPLDVNLYATKKTVAQGMMDLALLTANSNQLRYVLESAGKEPSAYFYVSVVLISLSIILQLIVGVALVFLGRHNISRSPEVQDAEKLNNKVILGILLVTVVNIFISAFGVHPNEVDPALIIEEYNRYMTEKLQTTNITERL